MPATFLRTPPSPTVLLIAAALSGATDLAVADDTPVLPTVRVSPETALPRAGARLKLRNDSTALPSAVSVVTADELESINVGRDIAAIYRRVPGVVANNIDQGDTGVGFRMRGFTTQGSHGADTAVYVDGVPQNMPSSQSGAGHGPVFLEWLTPEMIERIEVIKGPISSLHGDQNRAGAVDITTAKGGDQPSSVGITLESYNGKRANLVLSNTLESVDSLFIADLYRADGYRHASRTERDSFFWKLSTRHQGTDYALRLSHYRSDFEAAGYLLYSDLKAGLDPRSTQFDNPGYGSAERTSLVFNAAPAQGPDGIHGSGYIEQFERTRAIAASNTAHNVTTDDRVIMGGRLFNSLTLAQNTLLTFGGELRRDNGDAFRQRYSSGQATASYLNNYDMDLLTYGLFAQGQYRPWPTFKLLGGLRHDWFDYDIRNRKLPGASTSYQGSVTTPKLGVVWHATEALELFANAAEGFRSPYAEQISPAGTLGPLGSPGGKLNTDISASKVRSYDLGFTASPRPGWTLSGTAYQITNQDEIVMISADTYASVGETTRRGFEVETRMTLTSALSAYANYARITEARIRNPLPNTGALLSVPGHQVKAGVEHRNTLLGGRLTVNADVYAFSDVPFYQGTPQTHVADMPAYVRYDLRARFESGPYQVATYLVFQPNAYASDAAYGASAGLMVSPMPRTLIGTSLRYAF